MYILLLWIYVFTLSFVLSNLVHMVLIFDNIKTFVVLKVKPLKELTGHAESLDRIAEFLLGKISPVLSPTCTSTILPPHRTQPQSLSAKAVMTFPSFLVCSFVVPAHLQKSSRPNPPGCVQVQSVQHKQVFTKLIQIFFFLLQCLVNLF